MSYGRGPRTERMFCHDPECPHSAGIHIKWAPDSDDGPGWPYTDSCPRCRGDLHMEPLPEPEEVES